MISSLANFLTLMFYHGDFPARVSWIVMMYTLGAVAIARVAIEQDRAYSLGYAVILGIVAFIAMLRFLDSPIFVILILLTIGYLSDAIVRDCTLIDDSADSSDQGLLDSGKQYLKEQMDSVPQSGNTDASTITASNTDLLDSNPSKPTRSRKTNQPGRTVMYLALAALPLFGIGQLFLRDDPATWQRAQRLLAFYLFSALSLLVTTSFLGLRRYLRQRKAEMPNEVSIGWISTGLLLISGILVIAFAVPVPGRTLATLDINLNLESSDGMKPSQFGWGKEGTKEDDAEAAKVIDPEKSEDDSSNATQSGAPEGQAQGGNRDSGPQGQQSGGQQSGNQQSGNQQSGNSSTNGEKPDSDSQSKDSNSNPPNGQAEGDSQSGRNGDGGNQQPEQGNASEESSNNSSTRPEKPGDAEQQQQQQQSKNPPSQILSKVGGFLGGLVKLLIYLILAGIVGVYLWKNRAELERLWNRWFATESVDPVNSESANDPVGAQPTPRSFQSFNNPIQQGLSPTQIVVITFQAFEAWARDRGICREEEETPSEFLKRFTKHHPDTARPVTKMVDAYQRLVYGRLRPQDEDIASAESLWTIMNQTQSQSQ